MRQFRSNPTGHRRALEWITGYDLDVESIEGSGNCGADLARALVAAGITVKEVAGLCDRKRAQGAPPQGKSNPVDARAIARGALRGEGLRQPMNDGPNADLKLIVAHRDQLIRASQRVANRTHTLLACNLPGYESKVAGLSSKKASSLSTAARILGEVNDPRHLRRPRSPCSTAPPRCPRRAGF